MPLALVELDSGPVGQVFVRRAAVQRVARREVAVVGRTGVFDEPDVGRPHVLLDIRICVSPFV